MKTPERIKDKGLDHDEWTQLNYTLRKKTKPLGPEETESQETKCSFSKTKLLTMQRVQINI